MVCLKVQTQLGLLCVQPFDYTFYLILFIGNKILYLGRKQWLIYFFKLCCKDPVLATFIQFLWRG